MLLSSHANRHNKKLQKSPTNGQENKSIKDQDQVQLKVIPNDKSGFTVQVLTYREYYNDNFDFDSNATLYNFLHRWEKAHGIDIGKSRSRIVPDRGQQKLAKLIQDNVNPDTLLKDLVNKNIEWYSFRPGYEKNKTCNINKFNSKLTNSEYTKHLKKRPKMSRDPYPPQWPAGIVLNLSKLFENDKGEKDKFEWCLKRRGWILIEFPKQYQKDIASSSKIIGTNLEKYMKLKNIENDDIKQEDEWKTLCDNFGYTNFKDYKSVLRIYTNKILKLFKNEYPKDVIESIEKISNIMDNLSMNLIKSTLSFWLKEKIKKDEKIDMKIMDELCLNNDGFGMIDYVLYKNNKEVKDQKYKMLENGTNDNNDGDDNKEALNVDSHIDPGLFSISFFQINRGLQLLDRFESETDDQEWMRIPEYNDGKYGVLWVGQYAFQMNKNISCGIHRVDYNPQKPRLTGWYEVCIKDQIPNKVFEAVKQIENNQ